MNEPSLFALRTVVFATGNRGKIRELQALLDDLPILLVPLSEATPQRIDIVEDGATFEANAIKKARIVADALAMPTIADDSGLEVDALEGRPGVRSARYAGEGATDAENNRKLLAELSALGPGPRHARFRCALAFVDPVEKDRPIVTHGACEGEITSATRGTGGFGYDPIFLVRDAGGRTMAELSEHEKNARSHRAQAMRAMLPTLRRWLRLPE